MRSIFIILGALFLLLQYALWFSPGGVISIWHLQHVIKQQQQSNANLAKRNSAIHADIRDLKSGNKAIEAHARQDLGMIKSNETFYQVVKTK